MRYSSNVKLHRDDPICKRIAKRIKQIRGDRSLNQMARDLDVAPSYIQRWEEGTPLTLGAILRLCETEHVRLEWLVYGEGDPFWEYTRG